MGFQAWPLRDCWLQQYASSVSTHNRVKQFFRSILQPCEVASAATSYLESGGASHASVLLEHYGSLPTVKEEPPQQSSLLRWRGGSDYSDLSNIRYQFVHVVIRGFN